MILTNDEILPSREEQIAAKRAHDSLEAMLSELHSDAADIKIDDTGQKIKLPVKALRLLSEILKETGRGASVSLIANDAVMTTQEAADFLGCSRPHLIKLMEKGDIKYDRVGKHRRVQYRELTAYQRRMKAEQRRLLAELMQADEEAGLYDI